MWGDWIAKHLDLLANPAITYKNKKIVENLINNYIPSLKNDIDQEGCVFNCAIRSLNNLLERRYKLNSGKMDPTLVDFFNAAVNQCENKTFTVHEAGAKEDIYQ